MIFAKTLIFVLGLVARNGLCNTKSENPCTFDAVVTSSLFPILLEPWNSLMTLASPYAVPHIYDLFHVVVQLSDGVPPP